MARLLLDMKNELGNRTTQSRYWRGIKNNYCRKSEWLEDLYVKINSYCKFVDHNRLNDKKTGVRQSDLRYSIIFVKFIIIRE